jgi:fructan beta-fructosidase
VNSPEPYRPALHFSPRSGWMNDPNGLIQKGGTWHLFYQHEPSSTVHGPMHWGHASSPDLTTWTEHPIALYPDATGTCFSGSAIETPSGEVKLFYTAHRTQPDGSDFQTQCLVHADGELARFTPDPHNPVVGNPGLAVFRDPKVFWHAQTQRWIMVVTHGQSIGVRSSTDLVQWVLESAFGENDGQHGDGPWECPDLFPLQAPDGTTRWVLMVGIGSDSYGGGSGTQYFIGDFDGHHFVNGNPPETVLWADYGRDYYAAQSFFGARRPTTIAWASNWQYARVVPTVAFRGAMTLPRELSLVDGQHGLRLRQSIPAAVSARFELLAPGQTPTRGTYRLALRLSPSSELKVSLFGSTEPHFVVSHRGKAVHLRTLRTDAPGIPELAHDYSVELPSDADHIDIFVDNGLVELFAADGLVCITNLHFPADPSGVVQVASMLPLTDHLAG